MSAPTRGVVFVTGTDTDVGKTVATAWLAWRAVAAGSSVAVYKPVQTGVDEHAPGDAELVATLVPQARVSTGVRLPEPLAPVRAASRAGIALPPIDWHARRIATLATDHDVVLVEGAGGVRVELAGSATLLHLARLVPESDVIVVVRAGLGTLNHTTLTCDAIRAHGFGVAGVLIGSWPDDPDLAARCNALDLPAAAGAPLTGALREGATRDLTTAFIPPEELS